LKRAGLGYLPRTGNPCDWFQVWHTAKFKSSSSERDTVIGVDGKRYTSDQATIWRWRKAFQHDFAARMDWTLKEFKEANHNPVAVVNRDSSKQPIFIDAKMGTPVT
jgi:hypothetical protein